GDGIGAGGEHLMDRIEAAAEQTGLRPIGVERNAERKYLAGANKARSFDNILRRDVVERADLVVFPQRPQFRSFCEASAIAFLSTLMSILAPGLIIVPAAVQRAASGYVFSVTQMLCAVRRILAATSNEETSA